MSEYAPDIWRRLARLLRSRRVHVDSRFSKRSVFCKATGLNYKLVQDIEGAPDTRTSFSEEAFALFEGAYRWAPGSVQRVLEGGDPVEVASVTGSASLVATAHVRAEAEVIKADQRNDDGLTAAIRELAKRLPPDEVRSLLQEFAPAEQGDTETPYSDPTEAHLWRTPGLDERQRRFLIYQLQAMRRLESGEVAIPESTPGEVRELRKRG